MANIQLKDVPNYVESLELPEPPKKGAKLESADAGFDFDKVRDQMMVNGSQIVAFVKGVTPEWRQDIANSTLLAQLHAKKVVGDAAKVFDWYNAYFNVLMHIGWVVQEQNFSKYKIDRKHFQTDQVIIDIAKMLIGASSGALAAVKGALDSLKKSSNDSPLTLFHRESISAETAHFQVTTAENDPNNQLIVTLMAFALIAKKDITKVLFCEFKSEKIKLHRASGNVTINPDFMTAARQKIKDSVQAYIDDYWKELL